MARYHSALTENLKTVTIFNRWMFVAYAFPILETFELEENFKNVSHAYDNILTIKDNL